MIQPIVLPIVVVGLMLLTGCCHGVMPREDRNIGFFSDMAYDYSTSAEQYEFRGQMVRVKFCAFFFLNCTVCSVCLICTHFTRDNVP
jgi:hypothetical protein